MKLVHEFEELTPERRPQDPISMAPARYGVELVGDVDLAAVGLTATPKGARAGTGIVALTVSVVVSITDMVWANMLMT
jgi:hypothetical protein